MYRKSIFIVSIFIFLILSIFVLLFLAPFIDHFFYIDKKLDETEEYKIFIMIIIHIILLGILVYMFHIYLVKKYIKYFKLNKTYIKIIDILSFQNQSIHLIKY